jgi:hypothetical protein
MNAAQWEAFTERAAIMEKEGLNRRSVILRAFELCFPADYRECMQITANAPDGETALYEYLEEQLIKTSPYLHEKWATMNTETKNDTYNEKDTESPLQAREIRPTRQGITALEYMTAHGIPVIGAYQSGAMIDKQDGENFTTDTAELAALIAGRGNRQGKGKGEAIKRFYFIPAEAGLLCLDIDRKPGKADGLREFYREFPKETLPRALQDIEGGSFPCFVSTPSAGYHLYFKYSGPPVRNANLCPEVEIKHGKPGLTAPGSEKENGAYILHGDIEGAPPLYGIILDRIDKPQTPGRPTERPEAKPRTANRYPNASPQKPRITLDTLAAEAVGAYSGHHDRQVSFAGRACRCKYPYAETLAYVTGSPAVFGNGADTESTILSVYRQKEYI